MSTRLATRMSLRFLATGLVAGFVLSLAPTAPAFADEGPVVRQPRVRVAPPRVRTVERVRYVPVYYTTGCGGCATAVVAPTYYVPTYYAPRYYAGCGGCAQSYFAEPYSWAVRYARYRAAYGYGYGAGYGYGTGYGYGARYGYGTRYGYGYGYGYARYGYGAGYHHY